MWYSERGQGGGGILRDMEGIARGIFSGAVGTNVAEEAEIGAVKFALEMFASMNWKSSNSLVIKVDIETAKCKIGFIVFSLADRNGNDMAFQLALVGVNRPHVFKACSVLFLTTE
ncbi:hypothetical protein PVK06_022112 [Gossypium arboreum]|uniref:RNase H type-1 domain-containing protein n=1 Tax=Gossypium arboreum TaxID=29729 RepID=A0ABR0P7C6_GOSAR|nr:hypothetical protein PVK06_022112 [Gossypium arboreum]